MASETIEVFIDFKSPYCFVLLASLETIPRDYHCETHILPFLTSNNAFDRPANSSDISRRQRMALYKLFDAKRYASLQGISMLDSGLQVDTEAGLYGILWMNKNNKSKTLHYCKMVFEQAWINPHPNLSIHWIKEAIQDCGIETNGFEDFISELKREDNNALKGRGYLNEARDVVGVPCFFLPNSQESFYSQYSLSFVRKRLHDKLLFRSKDVLPDVTCAFRYPEPKIRIDVYGMPSTHRKRELQVRYRKSHGLQHYNRNSKAIDVYIDIKSPHAYLAMEMSRALEEDFNVDVNFLPFTLPIGNIYGNATKKAKKATDKSSKQETRNTTQWKMVKYGYKVCRELAALQNTKILGTPKVYDSTLGCIAMIWASNFGRKYLDDFLDFTFPLMWQRKFNIEDIGEVEKFLVSSGVPIENELLGSFRDYAAAEGLVKFKSVMNQAAGIGVLGVPTFVIDGEVFFGKEHLSLIRLKLSQQGLGLNAETPIDVPYLWRPTSSDRTGAIESRI
eukprot:CAMPEP_0184008620 /NCGR_PEP_ID=MMETSP0954-20121128/2083_1 /TAXON_ID=627963 /ORGANISM="Aplanochytrium sp, Strain PBS07" /LENGTH=505 /DNA_ID=CAMNT_0026287767 /DNA_START=13 /DNA_END=1530 /DNA_ORIENTATION=+